MMIDLGGTESPDASQGTTSEIFLEGTAINLSLMEFGMLFREISGDETSPKSWPFSKFLGSAVKQHPHTTKLVMVAHLSPEHLHQQSTEDTLQRAFEATQVVNPANQQKQQEKGKK